MKAIFWASCGLVLYTYAVYPLLLVLIAGTRQVWDDLRFAARRKDRRRQPPAGQWPSVSLCIAVYNEEPVIVDKMRNCAALDYPPEKLEVLLGCDGCTDATAELARTSKLRNLIVYEFPGRSGKSPTVDRLVEHARGEIVAFSDANTMLDAAALRRLARHFSDPRVGCVSGEPRFLPPEGGPDTESLYWRYETTLRFLESRLNMLLGAQGALYAVRRALYAPLGRQPADDFLLPMRIQEAGYRQMYDPEAIAYEGTLPSVEQEFRRRIRNLSGTLPAVMATLHLLSPTAGRLAFSYWSHKVLRWLAPFAMVIAFGSAVFLSGQAFYLSCAAGGLILAALALAGHFLAKRGIHHRLFTVPYYFLSQNLALMIAFGRFLTGRHKVAWERTRDAAAVKQTAAAAGAGDQAKRSDTPMAAPLAMRKSVGSDQS